ncbi:hypothetical protein ES703_116737 [subsurface metagenome]
MVGRVKAGKKAAAGNPGIVGLLRDLGSGDFIPGYKKYKRSQYEALKPALDVLTKHLPEPVKVSWEIVDRMADIIFKK